MGLDAAPAGGELRTHCARAVPVPAKQSSLRRLRKLVCGALGPAARSSLMVRSPWLCLMLGLAQCSARGWVTGFFGKANSRQKRGPAAGRRRRGAPRGAGISARRCSHTEIWSVAWRATPSIISRDTEIGVGLPGAANNTGDEACLREDDGLLSCRHPIRSIMTATKFLS